jgi:hypothetical protein
MCHGYRTPEGLSKLEKIWYKISRYGLIEAYHENIQATETIIFVA